MKLFFIFNKSILLIVTLFSLTFIILSCSGSKSEEKIFNENVEACMKPLVEDGLDTNQAKKVCECALKAMIELDSGYLKMDYKKQSQLFDENKSEIIKRCEELKKLIKE